MNNTWLLSASVLMLTACVTLSACASKPGVLVVEDESRVRGCRPLGTVADNEMEDLQKKAAKLGGNVALMTPQRKVQSGYFGLQEYTTADVYLCEASK